MGDRIGVKHFAVDYYTHDLITVTIKKEFLKNNPEFAQMNLNAKFLITRIAAYYLTKDVFGLDDALRKPNDKPV